MSLDPMVAAAARAAVAAGHAPTVSAYVEDTLAARAEREAWLARWRALTGGPPAPEYAQWAMRALGVLPPDQVVVVERVLSADHAVPADQLQSADEQAS